jgi:hypothetical protein
VKPLPGKAPDRLRDARFYPCGSRWGPSQPETLSEPNMRTLLAFVLFAGGIFALNAPADAARNYKRSAKSPQYYYYRSRASVCEERARAEDPTGVYASFPCWAREAFGRGTQGGGRGRSR